MKTLIIFLLLGFILGGVSASEVATGIDWSWGRAIAGSCIGVFLCTWPVSGPSMDNPIY